MKASFIVRVNHTIDGLLLGTTPKTNSKTVMSVPLRSKTIRPRVRRIYAALCGVMLFAVPSVCQAADLVFPGIKPKLGAGAGQTISRGSEALFYNPANAIYMKWMEPYVDASFASVNYTYAHPDTEKFSPVTVSETKFPVTAGAGFRPVPSFAMGVAAFPTGFGNVTATEGVPLKILSDEYRPMLVETKKTGYKIAAGAAFRIAHPLTLGAGLVHGSRQNQILITPEEATEPLIDGIYSGTYNQFTVGARSEVFDRAVVLAASYRSAATIAYKGDLLVNENSDSEFEPHEGGDYAPARIGVGAEGRIGDFALFVDYVREMWSKGRFAHSRGLPNEGDGVNYVDTNNIFGGAKLWIAGKHMLTAAGGYLTGNIGETAPPKDEEGDAGLVQDGESGEGGDAPVLDGVRFGDRKAIDRLAFSGGYRYKLTGHGYVNAGFYYASGERLVPEGLTGQGFYTLKVMMGSLGIAFGF